MGYRIHVNLKEELNTKKIDVAGASWYKNQYWNSEVFKDIETRKKVKRDLRHDEMGFDCEDAYRYDYLNWREFVILMIRNGHEYSDYFIDVLRMIDRTIKQENIKPKYIIISEW